MRCFVRYVLACVLVLPSLALRAQTGGFPAQANPLPAPPAPKLASGEATAQARGPLTLDVVVTDKAGRPVPGLGEHAFAFTDNGAPSVVRSFVALTPAAPLPDVVFVVDGVNTRFTNVAFERDQLKRYIASLPDPLPPVTLVVLSDAGAQIQPRPTTDRAELLRLVAGLDVQLRFLRRSGGVYGAGERLGISLRALDQLAAYEATQPGRKLVVWMSPGWPLLTGPEIELTGRSEQAFFRDAVSIATAMERARITLDAVDPLGTADAGGFRTFYYGEFVKPVKRAQEMQIGNLGLQVLAVQSGGVVLNSNNDLLGELRRCVDQDRSVYTVTLDRRPGEHPDDLHVVAVKVEGSGVTARTRFGYYAQP